MQRLFIILILVLFFSKVNAQTEIINKEWIKADSLFIAKVINAYKTDPLSIGGLLSSKGDTKEKLGFGYYLVTGSNGKGYVSLFYELIYFNNQLVSYQLRPQLPHNVDLIERYKHFYSALYPTSNNQKLPPVYYGFNEMVKPLEIKFKINQNDPKIMFYMTPYSGIIYSNYSDPSMRTNNRSYFTYIRNKITPTICKLLLYSKNPATRLTAIEFYYKHKNQFHTDKKDIERRIKIIFDELPTVMTMSADLEYREDARALVSKFVNNH